MSDTVFTEEDLPFEKIRTKEEKNADKYLAEKDGIAKSAAKTAAKIAVSTAISGDLTGVVADTVIGGVIDSI